LTQPNCARFIVADLSQIDIVKNALNKGGVRQGLTLAA